MLMTASMISDFARRSSVAAQRELVGDRDCDEVRDHRSVQRREQRDGHRGRDLLRVVHRAEHLHQADQRADHAHRGRRVTDRFEDRLTVAMTLQR
jgi:hypothetical protein